MNDKNEILHVYREYLDAMVAGGTEKIAEFITDDFVLVHITGYEQPGEEWLREMGQGQFIYHGAREQTEPTLTVSGNSAQLSSRIITDATVYGSRNNWHLAFTIDFVQQGGNWLLARNQARTW
ncbi:nuclear transport factor 2 family protein [Rothia terrae]|uniref:Nuclear transport factor 2 family protein n=1 Tax=Rothia terrae TaxID=396015 RepID=A0A7H2BDU6_9MICC|nr:nuclear transport factor 2 family protein [Rothia terrae]QNV37842.1 nuclear transport factor 2 family protein [Rothia terrae]